MYICEKCHDTDSNAIKCIKTYKGHHMVLGDYRGYCEICGSYCMITLCNRYEYEKIQEKPLKCPTCIMKFTCTRLLQHGPDSPKVLLCSMYKKEPANSSGGRRDSLAAMTAMRENFKGPA